MTEIFLPRHDGGLEHYGLSEAREFPKAFSARFNRVAFAAAHVVADPFADNDPWLQPAIDWDTTIAYRRYLWDLGLGVAEAMDTAQRGMGLNWENSLELIRRSVDAAKDVPGEPMLFSGAGTDHLAPGSTVDLADVIAAYDEQCGAVQQAGSRIILMASRALAAAATRPDDYLEVYRRVLANIDQPVIIHWLGEMFDPALKGYWGNEDHYQAMETCLAMIQDNVHKVDGIKVSLLDDEKEIVMRRRLPEAVRMYSGDDFNYPALIAGDEEGYSDALLGIFDPIAPAASAALQALAAGDEKSYHDFFAPTVPLSRHIFKAPTQFYKTGVVLMAYLNGHQNHFTMVGGQESARSTLHLADVFRLADRAGLLIDPERAASRMRAVLATRGVGR